MATDWNIMIYLAGDNNLSPEMVWAIEEIASRKTGNFVSVHFDPRSLHIPAQRYWWLNGHQTYIPEVQTESNDPDVQNFRKDMKKNKIPVPPKMDLDNTGDPMALVYFVWWALGQAMKHKPTHHMLILSGHGAGSDGDFLTDDTSCDSLTIPQLAKALEYSSRLIPGGRIDILGLDSCLMSTAEVYYEVSKSVDLMIAAEGFEADTGWPFHNILSGLGGLPEDVARKIVADYLAFYAEYAKRGGLSTDLSASRIFHPNTGEREPPLSLTNLIRKLSRHLRSAVMRPRLADAIILAHWKAQSYKSDQYTDLFHFASILRSEISKISLDEAAAGTAPQEFQVEGTEGVTRPVPADVRTIMANLDQACIDIVNLSSTSIVASGYVGPAFQHSRGLSVYFPWSTVSCQYKKMKFAKATGWDDFVKLYVERTRGLARIKGSDQFVNPADGGGYIHYPGKRQKHVDEPHKHTDEPWKLGLSKFVSMKNPPLWWDDCDLLPPPRQRTAVAGTRRLKKGRKGS